LKCLFSCYKKERYEYRGASIEDELFKNYELYLTISHNITIIGNIHFEIGTIIYYLAWTKLNTEIGLHTIHHPPPQTFWKLKAI
jgi:hypothetical protein